MKLFALEGPNRARPVIYWYDKLVKETGKSRKASKDVLSKTGRKFFITLKIILLSVYVLLEKTKAYGNMFSKL